MIFIVRFMPTEDGGIVEEEDPPVQIVKPYKEPVDQIHPFTRFRLNEVQAQDHMAWETQGPIADRTRERLATSDAGVVLLRDMMFREMKRVEEGLDPKGVVREATDNIVIDTHLMESIREMNFWREGRELPESLRV
jgi:5,5'-dehydrodivanillate O-demethylase oxygenase subunit